MTDQPQVLPFSLKYNATHSKAYFEKHHTGVQRQSSNYLEQRMAKRALGLAGEFSSVLDLPCGTGRFWELLHQLGTTELIAADYSQDMLDVAVEVQPASLLRQTQLLQTSAFAIDLPENAVDLVFCMRLLHHVGFSVDRIKILKEFARVSKGTSIVSLWVDGNLQSHRRRKLEATRMNRKFQNRFVVQPETFESDAEAAGHEIVGHFDLFPGISMWRTYVLRCK